MCIPHLRGRELFFPSFKVKCLQIFPEDLMSRELTGSGWFSADIIRRRRVVGKACLLFSAPAVLNQTLYSQKTYEMFHLQKKLIIWAVDHLCSWHLPPDVKLAGGCSADCQLTHPWVKGREEKIYEIIMSVLSSVKIIFKRFCVKKSLEFLTDLKVSLDWLNFIHLRCLCFFIQNGLYCVASMMLNGSR